MKKILLKVLLITGVLVAGANNDFYLQGNILLGDITYLNDLIKGEH